MKYRLNTARYKIKCMKQIVNAENTNSGQNKDIPQKKLECIINTMYIQILMDINSGNRD